MSNGTMRILACLFTFCVACVADDGSGDVHLTGVSDLRSIPQSTRGNVYLYDDWTKEASSSEVSVATLAFVGGDLFIQPQGGITVLRFPDLREVEGAIFIEETSTLERVELPALVAANRLVVRANHTLQELEVDAFAQSSGVLVELNPELTSLHLPALEGPTRISVTGNHALRELGLPRLEQAFDFDVGTNPSLEELRLERLRSTHRLHIEALYAVQAIEFPVLEQARSVSFHALPRLRELRLPRVREVWQLRVSDIDLTAFEAPSLRIGTVSYLSRIPSGLRRLDFRSYDCESELGFEVWAPRCLIERALPHCDLDAMRGTYRGLPGCECRDGAEGVDVDCSGEEPVEEVPGGEMR